MKKRIAILVTGMHRCETSALTRTFAMLGAKVPKALAPNERNPQSDGAPSPIIDLNHRMLADAGSDPYSTIEFNRDWFASPRALAFVDEAVNVLRTVFENDAFVALIDPQVALTLPIWELALDQSGYTAVHVILLRHPTLVAASLRQCHLAIGPYDAWSWPRGELVWLRYMLAAVRGSRGRQRSFLQYSALVVDWRREVMRIAAETGIVWPRHGRADRDIDLLYCHEQADPAAAFRLNDEVGPIEAVALGELPIQLYSILVTRDDEQNSVDSLGDEYCRRLVCTRDLIWSYEALHLVIETYSRETTILRDRIAWADQSQVNLRRVIQNLWLDLTQTINKKTALHHERTAAANQVKSLDDALGRTRSILAETSRRSDESDLVLSNLRLQLQNSREALDVTNAEMEQFRGVVHSLHQEIQSLLDDRDAILRDFHQSDAALNRHLSDWEDERAALQDQVYQLQTSMSAIASSYSWRWTKPLRGIQRLFRR